MIMIAQGHLEQIDPLVAKPVWHAENRCSCTEKLVSQEEVRVDMGIPAYGLDLDSESSQSSEESSQSEEKRVRKMARLEEVRCDGYVVVFNRATRGTLHRAGEGGCWMARSAELASSLSIFHLVCSQTLSFSSTAPSSKVVGGPRPHLRCEVLLMPFDNCTISPDILISPLWGPSAKDIPVTLRNTQSCQTTRQGFPKTQGSTSHPQSSTASP